LPKNWPKWRVACRMMTKFDCHLIGSN
jgi:hypothetical protein